MKTIKSNSELLFEFVDAINNTDIHRISELISSNHTFTDSAGNVLSGKKNIVNAWLSYFRLFPDYKIEITEIFEKPGSIMLYGTAGVNRTFYYDNWKIHAAWLAVFRNGKIKSWQVFADTNIQVNILTNCEKD